MLKVAMIYVTESIKTTAKKKIMLDFKEINYSFFVFDSKKERDEWVDKNAYDPYGKLVAAATTLKNVRYCMGRNFIIHGNIIVHSVDDLYA